MTAFRNNGIKFSKEQLTGADVVNMLEHTTARRDQAAAEAARLMDIAVEMGVYPNVVILGVEQAHQEYGPDGAA